MEVYLKIQKRMCYEPYFLFAEICDHFLLSAIGALGTLRGLSVGENVVRAKTVILPNLRVRPASLIGGVYRRHTNGSILLHHEIWNALFRRLVMLILIAIYYLIKSSNSCFGY